MIRRLIKIDWSGPWTAGWLDSYLLRVMLEDLLWGEGPEVEFVGLEAILGPPDE